MCAAPDILPPGVQDLFRATSIHSLAVLLLLAPDTTCTLLSNSSHKLVWRSCCRYDFFRLFQPGQLATWKHHGCTWIHNPPPTEPKNSCLRLDLSGVTDTKRPHSPVAPVRGIGSWHLHWYGTISRSMYKLYCMW